MSAAVECLIENLPGNDTHRSANDKVKAFHAEAFKAGHNWAFPVTKSMNSWEESSAIVSRLPLQPSDPISREHGGGSRDAGTSTWKPRCPLFRPSLPRQRKARLTAVRSDLGPPGHFQKGRHRTGHIAVVTTDE